MAHPFSPLSAISQELGLRPEQVQAVVTLLDEGATVPFIARYRKDRTGALDEVQVLQIQERLAFWPPYIVSIAPACGRLRPISSALPASGI